MHRERSEIHRSSDVDVGDGVLREPQSDLPVDSAGAGEYRAHRKPASHTAATVAVVRPVGDGENYFVVSFAEKPFRNRQLERRRKTLMRSGELAVHPQMHLVPDAFERDDGRAHFVETDGFAVEEAAVYPRYSYVGREGILFHDRETRRRILRIHPERIRHPGGAEGGNHVFPKSRNGVLYLDAFEARILDRLPRVRPVGHLPGAVKRHRIVYAMLVRSLVCNGERRRRQRDKRNHENKLQYGFCFHLVVFLICPAVLMIFILYHIYLKNTRKRRKNQK